jgi:hypothetical protein
VPWLSDLTSASFEVLLDEGGLRCASGEAQGFYVPFATIADAALDKDLRGRMVLVLASHEGKVARLPLATASPFDLHRVVSTRLAELTAAPPERAARTEVPSALSRGGRPLDEWLADVGRLGRGGYRDGAADTARLASLLDDEHADVDARAAAGFALVAGAEGAELVATARAFLEHALPPLVLAAARLAPGGAAIVDDAVTAGVKVYLDARDAEAVDAAPRDRSREALVADALGRARDAILAEPEPAATHRAAPGRRSHQAASIAAGVWVGRTWGI